jgi:hypothetical protein
MRHGDDEDLNHVDITTPLGADEVLVEPTHRVVAAATSHRLEEDRKKTKSKKGSSSSSKGGKTEKSKSAKADKGKDKEKDKDKGGHGKEKGGAVVDNLLSLDWNVGTGNTPPRKAEPVKEAPLAKEEKRGSTAKSSSSSSSSSGSCWIPLYTDKHLTISYSATAASSDSVVALTFLAMNHSKDGCSVSAAIKLQPNHPSRRFALSLGLR